MTTTNTNIMMMSGADFAIWCDGFLHGRIEGLAEGHAAGYAAANDEIATLQRTAAEVVHSMANLPERDRQADREQAEKRAAWWRRRRGEAC